MVHPGREGMPLLDISTWKTLERKERQGYDPGECFIRAHCCVCEGEQNWMLVGRNFMNLIWPAGSKMDCSGCLQRSFDHSIFNNGKAGNHKKTGQERK